LRKRAIEKEREREREQRKEGDVVKQIERDKGRVEDLRERERVEE
jgi:hypothetical protein